MQNKSGMKIILTGIVFLFLSFYSSASHLIGGELYYTHIGGNNYTVTLKIFRDCGPNNTNGTDFDAAVSIGAFYTNSNGLFTEISINLISTNVTTIPVVLDNPCFILPPDVCVEQAIYSGTITLPPVAGGYTLVHQRCCFQPSIDNLTAPQNLGVSYSAHVPGSNELNGTNSSPRFTNFPPPALCKDAEFTFDHSATDPDGDQIVYSFCASYLFSDPTAPAPAPPNNPPYGLLNYGPGFSPTYPITSNPAFTIDPVTGQLEGTATALGQYTITVCAEEYRNGVYLSTTRRTFQFNVTICDPSILAAVPEQTSFCNGLTVNLTNESTNSSFWHWDFGVPFEVYDTSNVENPTFTYPGPGDYTITLIANPGWSCADTATTTYTVYPEIDPIITLGNYACVNNTDEWEFWGSATLLNGGTYAWDFGNGSSPGNADVVHPQNIQLNSLNASNTITLTVTADNGCSESTTLVVNNAPDPVASIPPQDTFCDGLSYTFGNTSTNASSYWWEFNTVFNGDYADDQFPSFTFPDTGQYIIQLIASAPFTCPDTTTGNLSIYGNLQPSFPALEEQCFSSNSFDFQALGASTNSATYNWNFGTPNLADSNVQNPQNIHFPESGTFTVSLTISENGCTETYIDDIWVPQDPVLLPSIIPDDGCPPVFGGFIANATSDTQLFYIWNFGDGTTSTEPIVTHIYQNPGIYDVSLQVYTTTGCLDTLSEFLNNAITVYPLPTAAFTITPQTVSIFEPTTSITDVSSGAISCIYSMSDGGSSTECSFDYDWTEAGIQTISQTVTNEYGCIDQVSGSLFVEGFLFYAPNSFTPNQDGINEVWLPETTGTTSYKIEIYDRWGTLIFETDDPKVAWTGNVRKGNHYAENGVYQFHASMKDLMEQPHEFWGHIVLAR